MSLVLKPKQAKAPWLDAFPGQRLTVDKPRRRLGISSQSKHRQKRQQEYAARAKAFVVAAVARGDTCPVVAAVPSLRDGFKYGWPVCARLNEVHHIRGRLGALLMNERFWICLSKQGHRWVHANPDAARAHGWLAQRGDWNKAPGR